MILGKNFSILAIKTNQILHLLDRGYRDIRDAFSEINALVQFKKKKKYTVNTGTKNRQDILQNTDVCKVHNPQSQKIPYRERCFQESSEKIRLDQWYYLCICQSLGTVDLGSGTLVRQGDYKVGINLRKV